MTIPFPPAHLRRRAAGTDVEAHFDNSGRMSVADFARAVQSTGKALADFPRVLEWGCGCGRVLRHLVEACPRSEIHGCDIDKEAVGWLRSVQTYVEVVANEGLPPLPYPDGAFDLIVNYSVLTHLNERYQDAWLTELGRILDPNGTLVLSFHGPYAYNLWDESIPKNDPHGQALLKEARRKLAEEGIFFLDNDNWSADFPKFYQSTFHSPWYVFEHWQAFFDIAAYLPRGGLNHQDLVVLRHRQPMNQADCMIRQAPPSQPKSRSPWSFLRGR
jgi:SAM-dependent methyltransferase